MSAAPNPARYKTVRRLEAGSSASVALSAKRIAGHVLSIALTVALVWWTEQSPRVLLYATLFGVFARLATVVLLVDWRRAGGTLARLAALVSRPPRRGEKSRPYRDQKTGEPVGLASYIGGMVGVIGALMPLLLLGNGTGFLQPAVLLPELAWALVLTLVYWAEDLFSRVIVLGEETSVVHNLGYNLGSLHVFLGAIFLATAVICLIGIPAELIFGGLLTVQEIGAWVLFGGLVVVRQLADVLAARQRNRRPKLP